jgi:hypothetical protein
MGTLPSVAPGRSRRALLPDAPLLAGVVLAEHAMVIAEAATR